MDFLKSIAGKIVSGAVVLAVVAAGISWWRSDPATRQMLLSGTGRILSWLGIVLILPWASFFVIGKVARFDSNVAETRAALVGKTDAEMMAAWSLKHNGQKLFTMPKAAVWRGFVLNHLVHHRGQLSVYLRLNDVPVPAMYGPSADEAPNF